MILHIHGYGLIELVNLEHDSAVLALSFTGDHFSPMNFRFVGN